MACNCCWYIYIFIIFSLFSLLSPLSSLPPPTLTLPHALPHPKAPPLHYSSFFFPFFLLIFFSPSIPRKSGRLSPLSGLFPLFLAYGGLRIFFWAWWGGFFSLNSHGVDSYSGLLFTTDPFPHFLPPIFFSFLFSPPSAHSAAYPTAPFFHFYFYLFIIIIIIIFSFPP